MHLANQSELPVFDQSVYRNVAGHFASGVAVITTANGTDLSGATVSAVSSLSMDPPMMLVCINASASTHAAIADSGVFCVNILAEHQTDVAYHFARRGEDKFVDQAYTRSEHGGVPILDGVLSHVVCRVVDTIRGGTHTVFLGHVLDASVHDREPLSYYRGKFGRLQRGDYEAAYDAVRDDVLARRTPLNDSLDAIEIGEALRLTPDEVTNALMKLAAEGVVRQGEPGVYRAVPITPETVDHAYEARLTIEAGVLATKGLSLTDGDLADLDRIAARLAEVKASDDPLPYVKGVGEFHRRLITAAGSAELADSYRRLSIGPAWIPAADLSDWRTQLSADDDLLQVLDALRGQDVSRAIEALQRHSRQGRQLAHAAVERAGGSI